MFLWNKREIEFKEKYKNKLFNLSFFSFQRPKNNRWMKSSRRSVDVFMGHYRDWIYFFFLGGAERPPWMSQLKGGSLRSPQKEKYSISIICHLKDPKPIAEWKVVDVSLMFLWDIIEIQLKEKHKNKLFNLYNLSFWRPKKNRWTISRRRSMDLFIRHYRDWIIFFWGERQAEGE